VQDIKKRLQEYTEGLYKREVNDSDNNDGNKDIPNNHYFEL